MGKIDEKYLKHVGVLGMKWHSRKGISTLKQKILTRMKKIEDKKIKDLNSEDLKKWKKACDVTLDVVGGLLLVSAAARVVSLRKYGV